MVVDALHQVGAARSIVIDEDNVILAGNGVTEAAAEAGITRVRVIEASGEEIIAVRRSGLTEAQKRALAIYDNRTAELAEWSPEQLRADQQAGLDLKPWFSDEELEKIIGGPDKAGLTDPDDVPETRSTDIKAGEMFQLGSHRLMCEDSTNTGQVAKLTDGRLADLVLTDPPYGINIVNVDGGQIVGSKPYGSQTGRVGFDNIAKAKQYRPVHGDDKPFDPTHLLALGEEQIIFGGNFFASKLPDGKAWIVWDKDASGTFSAVELAWTSREGRLPMYRHMWSGLRREGSRRDELVERVHPTQKPVGLFVQILNDYSKVGDTVLDPYLGSGTTLIACERTSRVCFGCEIEPQYCQVIIDRWEAFTGQKAVKLGEVVPA